MTNARTLKSTLALVAALVAACTTPDGQPSAIISMGLAGGGADSGTELTLGCDPRDEGPGKGRIGAAVLLNGGCSTDPQSLRLGYHWTLASLPAGSRAALNRADVTAPSFVPDMPGKYTVRLIVSSGTLTAQDEIEIEVPPCGVQAPVAAIASSPTSPQTGEPVRLSTTVDDADNDAACGLTQTMTHEWRIVRQPPLSTAALNSVTSATPSFVPDQPGEYDVRVVVTDSTGRASVPVVATVTAGSCGSRAPSVVGIDASPTIPSVGDQVQLTSVIADGDTDCTPADEHSYSWSLVAIPRGSLSRLNSAVVRQPSFVADMSGDYSVRLVVTDAAGHQSAPRTITLNVPACGSAPPSVASLSFNPAAPNTGALVQLGAEVSDADSEPGCDVAETFTFQWQLVAQPAGSAARLNNAGAENPSFTADLAGEYAVRLWVGDRTGRLSSPRVERVTVSGCGGSAPVALASVADAAPGIGETVELSVAVADTDTEAACGAHDGVYGYEWWFTELPAGSQARLNDPRASTPSFVADVDGTYVVRVIAVDPTMRPSAVDEVTIAATTCGGRAPVVAPTGLPAAPRVGQAVALDAVASDVDTACGAHAADFTHRWWFVEVPPGSMARINDTGAARPSFTPDLDGRYVLRVVASDPTGLDSAPGQVTVDARVCGSTAPSVALDVAPGSRVAPNVGEITQLLGSASDSDTDTGCTAHAASFTWSWWFVSLPAGSMATLNDPAAVNPSFTPDKTGAYVLKAIATDPTGRAGQSAAFTVSASTCGTAVPAVTISGANSPDVGEVVQLAAAVADADTGATCGAHAAVYTYHWAFAEVPAGSLASLNDAGARNPSFTPDVVGAYVVKVTATDPTGRTGESAAFTVTADPCGSNFPVASIAGTPATGNVGQAVQLVATASSDADITSCGTSQTLFYRWRFVSLPAGSNAFINQPDAARPSFVPDVNGPYDVELVVTDSTGRSSAPLPRTITVAICGANSPVVSTIVAVPASPATGQAVRLTPTFTDNDTLGGCLAHAANFQFDWQFLNLPAGSQASFNDSSMQTPSFMVDMVSGTYRFRVTVTDPTGRSGFLVGEITSSACGSTKPNPAPFASPASVNAGAGVQLDSGAIADADNLPPCNLNQTHGYFWRLDSVPAGSFAFLMNPSAQRPSFRTDLPGNYTASLLVFDSNGQLSDAETVTIPAGTCGNVAPTALMNKTAPGALAACNGVTIALGGVAPQNIQLDAVTSTDPDIACAGQTLGYTWNLLATPVGATSNLNNRRARNPWFQANVAGTYQVQLIVDDSTGRLSTPQNCTLTIP